jgi:hypothetical protein
MASRRTASAARRGEGETQVAAEGLYDPTAEILDQYRDRYEAFERHLYADAPRTDRFGRNTAALPYRGEPEAAGEAFNPLNSLTR